MAKSKYTFSINGTSFTNARKALKHCGKLKKDGGKVETIRVNGEPMSMSALENEARTELREIAHNKAQGF